MSARAMVWVWEHSKTTGNARLVMLLIADELGGSSDTEVDHTELRRKARLSQDELEQALKECCALDELEVFNPEDLGIRRWLRVEMVLPFGPEE